jgi:hypothetical protein
VPDVRVGVPKPYLILWRKITKRHKPRWVPRWWDQRTLDDLTAWRTQRLATGATSGDALHRSTLAGVSRPAFATAFTRWWWVCGVSEPGFSQLSPALDGARLKPAEFGW